MKKIMVTGATGNLGSEVLQILVQKAGENSIFAMARDTSKLDEVKQKGVTVLEADYDNSDSLVKAFQGIDVLYFVSGSDVAKRDKQHENVIEAARKSGVKHVVYTSIQRKDESEFSPFAVIAAVHIKTEKMLKESGLNYTILKHTLYSNVLLDFLGADVIEKGVIYQPAGDGKVPFASRFDMAKAATVVLTTSGHENKAYEISAGKSYSYGDIAGMLSEICGKPISYVSLSAEEYAKALTDAGLPAGIVGMLGAFGEGIKQGEFDIPDPTLEQLIGEKPQELYDYLKEVYLN